MPSGTPAGVTPLQFAMPGPIGLETKIWSLPLLLESSPAR